MEMIQDLAQGIGDELFRAGEVLLRVAIMMAVAFGIARLARHQIEPRLAQQRIGRDGAILIGRLVSIAAYVIAFVSLMNQLGVNWTGLLTLLSAFTVAIGLSLQDVIKNFFSGILMLLERPFSVGDRVRVRDFEGEIQGIDIRTTLIRNTDGSLVHVPNSIMFGEILTNRSHFRTRRMHFTVRQQNRSIDDLERAVEATLVSMAVVRKPIQRPRIVSSSPDDGVALRYSILVQAAEDAEHTILRSLIKSLDNATIEADL